ncbi:hypothetical protein N474_02685 [Pseudoalteromonas luteoviolacea CPMOR-2]|uniref:Calx-beta domain-containing protein n=1 Tax=Pseudoalteromonas luteoviolacea DSM 6061 TaxID=1365250 RepID=A0A166UVH9_9GAMM|nr:Calx-beta domain-containing protein [Pseudoalteromonas luteoviolacea]KZN30858.1 hypothetical protein N475_23860 [Pseudoalteromonas luteoviolacea DSM 6061]KZN53421.1 hypothetical protein N474_02685 [Pseudoalteromonas luteoviolacea CPMOR-2]MBE0386227.1 hypothetical protein [Pseudoalteromonas luteoviolacea DSM 6061]
MYKTKLKQIEIISRIGVAALFCVSSLLVNAEEVNNIDLHFIVAASDSSGTNAQVDKAKIDESIQKLNAIYGGSGYSYRYKSTVFVSNNEMPGYNDEDYDPDNRMLFVEPYFDREAFNIMVADFERVNGRAFWPYHGIDSVLVDSEDLDKTTLAHEIGHNFSLIHTYSDGDEEPISVQIGSKGYLYGDQIIDTPPSHDGLEDDIEDCIYSGTAVDEEGTPFAPDAKNIMGQGDNTCRTHFSAQQVDRMQYVLQRDKYHLYNKYGKGRVIPTCENSSVVIDFPHFDGFNFNEKLQHPWVQDVQNNPFFFRTSPDSNSSSTGADEPYEGHSYLQVDSSKRDDTDIDGLVFAKKGDRLNYVSPCYDLSYSKNPKLEFYFNKHGVDMGTSLIEATIDNGNTWTELWRKEGEQHPDGDVWYKESVDLVNYRSSPMQLRLVHIIEGEKGDASFDAFLINGESVSYTYDFAASDVTVLENEGKVTIQLVRKGELDVSSTLRVVTEDVDAKAGSDYDELDTTIIFTKDESEKEIDISIFDNDVVDGARAFKVKLESDNLADDYADLLVTIDNEDIAYTYNLQLDSTQVSEAAKSIAVTIEKSVATDMSTHVYLKTEDDTAKSGFDYNGVEQLITFEAGETKKVIDIGIIDNLEVDGSRKFKVTLESDFLHQDYEDAVITITNEDKDPPSNGAFSVWGLLMLLVLAITVRRTSRPNSSYTD